MNPLPWRVTFWENHQIQIYRSFSRFSRNSPRKPVHITTSHLWDGLTLSVLREGLKKAKIRTVFLGGGGKKYVSFFNFVTKLIKPTPNEVRGRIENMVISKGVSKFKITKNKKSFIHTPFFKEQFYKSNFGLNFFLKERTQCLGN